MPNDAQQPAKMQPAWALVNHVGGITVFTRSPEKAEEWRQKYLVDEPFAYRVVPLVPAEERDRAVEVARRLREAMKGLAARWKKEAEECAVEARDIPEGMRDSILRQGRSLALRSRELLAALSASRTEGGDGNGG